ncbi:MAG: hypothetical protein AAGA30_12480 [Planctomycetota bacterium]
MDPDFLGVIGLVGTILFFVLMIVSVVSITRTFQNVSIAKLQNQMMNDLLAKGYSVDEIQQLMGGKRKNVLFRFFDHGRQTYVSRKPTPPVKNPI